MSRLSDFLIQRYKTLLHVKDDGIIQFGGTKASPDAKLTADKTGIECDGILNIKNAGELKYAGTAITATAAALNAIKGASAAYPKTTDGVQTLLAADSSARTVIIVAEVTETFADNTGGQPTFKIGETDADDKFAATSVFTDATSGTVKVLAGTLTAAKALIVTAAKATGDGAGALKVTALAV